MRPRFLPLWALLCYALSTTGQTTWTGVTSSDWFDNSNWTNNVPTNVNQPATIPNGPLPNDPEINTGTPPYVINFVVEVDGPLDIVSDVRLENFMDVQLNGVVNHNAGILTIRPSGIIENNGFFYSQAEIRSSGRVENRRRFVVFTGGIFRNNNGVLINFRNLDIEGTLINSSTWENYDEIRILAGGLAQISGNGTLLNQGVLYNFEQFRNSNTILNLGTFDNSGDFRNLNNSEFINQNNVFSNNGSAFWLVGNSMFRNEVNLQMGGNMTAQAGSQLLNTGNFHVHNSGTLLNQGLVQNENTVFNDGFITNEFQFLNNGLLANNGASTFDNSIGELVNGPCDKIQHVTANPLLGGTIENNGIVYAVGSNVAVTFGTGVVYNNLLSIPAPTAVCQNNFVVYLDGGNMASITVAQVDMGSNAPYCGIESRGISVSNFNCNNIGPNNVVLTVTDSLGTSSNCQITVTVRDTFAPSITCPVNITVNNTPGLCGMLVNYPAPVGTDNCPGAVTNFLSGLGSPNFYPVGVTTETYEVVDADNNRDTCSFTVTVLDNEKPVITCAQDMTVNLQPFECDHVFNFNITATDNCTASPVITKLDNTGLVSGDAFPIGATVLTYMAEDTSGNADTCSFTLTVHEYVPISSALVCNNNGQLSVSLDCSSEILPEMVLMGAYGCSDSFRVEIVGTGGNIVDTSHVGHTIMVKVMHIPTGNSCWGTISVEDKQPPKIDNCVNDTLLCLENLAPETEGGNAKAPTFSDCYDFDVLHYDAIQSFDCSANEFGQIITRTWIARDINGRSDTCIQLLYIRGIDFDSIFPICPPTYTTECNPAGVYNLYPNVTGYPKAVIQGDTLDLRDTLGNMCGIKADYKDDTLSTCGNSFKIYRTWRVIDCCSPASPRIWSCMQLIKVVDTTPPVIGTIPVLTVGVDRDTCFAKAVLRPAPVVDCSPYDVQIITPAGVVYGNGGMVPAPGLSVGSHLVTYMVTDHCSNSSSRSALVTVVDNRPPVAVCDAITTVSLTSDGTAFAYAKSFDDGSHDECCLDINRFEARRMTDNCGLPLNTTFRPTVDFCCADLGDSVMVVMRVYDCAGNYNECMVSVWVDNKLDPQLTCPPNVVLNCGDDYKNLALTGRIVTDPAMQRPIDGLVTVNCPGVDISFKDDEDLDCGTGTVTRTWQARTPSGKIATCIQIITLVNNDPFDGDTDIQWPADTTLFGCITIPDTSITGSPKVSTGSCDMVLRPFYEEKVIPGIGGSCLHIERKWIVIDWCQNDPLDPNAGRWEHIQIIKVIDKDPPLISNCSNRVFCNNNALCQPLLVDLSVGVSDACTPVNQLKISWRVDAFADGVPDVGAPFSGTGQNNFNAYPNGSHEICYTVEDGCGNVSTCCFRFKILDCKVPEPVCKPGLSTTLMMDGTVTLNAAIFDSLSTDNCTPHRDLIFSFSPDVEDTVKTFTCAEIGFNTVDIWVTDATGNQAFCSTFVIITDNMGVCTSPKSMVMGSIKNSTGQGVSNVQVQVNGQSSSMIKTGDDGMYQFDDLLNGADYTIAPNRNDNPRNGVSTYDLVLITKHILNVKPLDSPYKVIAADANKSNSVTTLDVVALRKLILFVSDELPNNHSWRFIDKKCVFADPRNPFATNFPEVFNINNLSEDELKADFIAIKVGDVTEDAQPNQLLGIDQRTLTEPLTLLTNNQNVRKGDLFTVQFKMDKNESLSGCQFTLEFDQTSLRMKGLMPGKLVTRENLGLALLDEGVLTFSWDNSENEALKRGQSLFELQFEALADGELSDMFNLSSQYTRAEAYDSKGNLRDVRLEYQDGKAGNQGFSLYQNKPNPFSGGTIIGFNLPEAMGASLTIYDLSGKILKVMSGSFEKGYNEFQVKGDELNVTGVMYYRLDTPTFTDTKKMILVPVRP